MDIIGAEWVEDIASSKVIYLAAEGLMLCRREMLSQAIGRHFGRIKPFNLETSCLHFLAYPEQVDIHVTQLGLKHKPLAHTQIDCLLIVTVDTLRVVRVELDKAKQAFHPIVVLATVADGRELSLSSGCCDGSLLPSKPFNRATE